MKHILTGVAVVAALAISAPAWAQPYGAGSGAQADQPVNPQAPYDRPIPPSWSQPKHHHARTHHAASGRGNMANQYQPASSAAALNQQELARIQGGGMMPAPR